MNLAPSDFILPLMLLLALGELKYCKPAWTIWHLGLVMVFTISSFVFALSFGELNRYQLVNKDGGLLLLYLSYAAITSTVTHWEDLRRILRVFVISVVAQNVVAVCAFFAAYFWGFNSPFVEYRGSRLAGMLVDPNAYGGLLVVTLLICEGASWGKAPLFNTVELFIGRLTLSLGILFTFSRSAWMALSLAFLVLCILRRAVAVRFVLIVVIGIPGLFVLMGSRFSGFFEHMASRPEQVQGRFEIMAGALAAFAQHPFLGGGLDSFHVTEETIIHNSALWFLADFGLVGLVVFLGFLYWFFGRAWFAYRFAPEQQKPLVLTLLLGHTAMLGLTMGIEGFYQRHWWLILALIASSYSIVRRELFVSWRLCQPRRTTVLVRHAVAAKLICEPTRMLLPKAKDPA